MAFTTMSQMWRFLDTFTLDSAGNERKVNQNNEWGGYSRRLEMPVFTGWRDFTKFDKESKITTALVSDTSWTGRPVGLANQERWIKFAEEKNQGVAAFFVIHADDENAQVRKIKSIDDEKVFVGKLRRVAGQVFLDGYPRLL